MSVAISGVSFDFVDFDDDGDEATFSVFFWRLVDFLEEDCDELADSELEELEDELETGLLGVVVFGAISR